MTMVVLMLRMLAMLVVALWLAAVFTRREDANGTR